MSETIMQVRDAKRHYVSPAGTVKALDGVSLSIKQGDFLVIAGPSGSGKSTLLNLLGLLDTPTSGSVFLQGQETGSLDRKTKARFRRETMGFVFQAYNLIPVLNVMENVEYVAMLLGWDANKRRTRVLEVLSQLGLDGLSTRFPHQLSGGQQQRVAVARAIIVRPQLVLADEPTANLDSTAGTALLDMMADLNQQEGITFVFSSHDPKVISRANPLIEIEDGKILVAQPS